MPPKAGMTFKAIVDDPVIDRRVHRDPRGASARRQAVKVEQSGKLKGSDKISLKLNSIGLAGGRTKWPRPTSKRKARAKASDRAKGRRRRRPGRHRRRHRGRR